MRRRDEGWRSRRNQGAPPPPPATGPAEGTAPPPPPSAARRAAPFGRGGRFDTARRLAGTRGGAARSMGAATAPDVAPSPAPPQTSSADVTYDTPMRGSPLKGVEWSISLVGFLIYIYVITTYAFRVGDVAMAVALVGLFFVFDKINFPTMLGLMAAFVVWSAVSYTSTDYPSVVGTAVRDFAKLWLIVLVAVAVLNTRANVRLFMILFLGCFALYPTRGAIINYLGGNTLYGRAIWNHVYSNPNDLAALALLQLSMAFGLFRLEREKWLRYCAMAGMVLMPLLVLMTQSRGAFIALAFFGLFIFAVQRRRARAFVIMASIAAVAAMAAPRGVWQRVGGLKNATSTESLDKADTEGSARQRYEIWRVAARIIEDHPFLGVGRGAYSLAHAEYAATRSGLARTARGKRDTHSTYLNVAAETGYPGLLLFLALVGWTLFAAERARRRARQLMPESAMQLFALEAGLVAMLVAGIWGSFSSLSFLYLHLALVTAVTRLTAREVSAIERGTLGAPRPLVGGTPSAAGSNGTGGTGGTGGGGRGGQRRLGRGGAAPTQPAY